MEETPRFRPLVKSYALSAPGQGSLSAASSRAVRPCRCRSSPAAARRARQRRPPPPRPRVGHGDHRMRPGPPGRAQQPLQLAHLVAAVERRAQIVALDVQVRAQPVQRHHRGRPVAQAQRRHLPHQPGHHRIQSPLSHHAQSDSTEPGATPPTRRPRHPTIRRQVGRGGQVGLRCLGFSSRPGPTGRPACRPGLRGVGAPRISSRPLGGR